MEIWSAVVGAVIGAAASALVSWRVFEATHRLQSTDAAATLRRHLTAAFVRDLADIRECVANPSRNLERMAGVEASLAASYAAFVSHLAHDDAAVSEFASRLKHAVRFASTPQSVWADEETLRLQGVQPLLRWATADDTYPRGWFREHLTASQAVFNRTRFDIEPVRVRRALGEI